MFTQSPTAHTPLRVLRDAVLITAAAALLGLVVNLVRDQGLPFVQHEEYEILVPCPEMVGAVEELLPGDSSLQESGGSWLVDARSAAEFSAWHLPGAVSVPYDWLDPTPDSAIKAALKSGADRVVVYGDGADPDSGKELAREFSGRGLTNVYFVRGGQPALQQAGVASEGGAP